jgi:hypothetical protein
MNTTHVVVAALSMVIMVGSTVAGCTYIVSENNKQYYETLKQCIDNGGSWVPTSNNGTNGTCISKR